MCNGRIYAIQQVSPMVSQMQMHTCWNSLNPLKTDITAGIVSGALSGAVSGAAVDLAIAGYLTCGGVVVISGLGGAASSYVNQQMNGVPFSETGPGTIIIDAIWGAVGGALSFGTADVGGKMCKTLAENLALKGKDFWNQVGSDFATSLITTTGTWLNGTQMNLLSED